MSDNQNEQEKKSFKPVIILAIIVFGIAGALYWASENDVNINTAQNTEDAKELTPVLDGTNDEEWAYLVGYLFALQAKPELGVDNPQDFERSVARGVRDAFSDEEFRFTEAEVAEVFKVRQAFDQERALKQGEENKAAGEAFVAEYAQQDGVETTENGTLYKKLTAGEGDVVGENVALVQYVGKHIDGTEFDSSTVHGDDPIPFTGTDIIPGLWEAISLMTKGDKWEIVVPVETGYGMNVPPGAPIKPNEALIFEVEVVDIQEMETLDAEEPVL